MALSIGVTKNTQIQIGSDLLTVIDVFDMTSISVRINNGPTLTLNANAKTEIMPNVMAYCGINAQGKHQGARIAIEAAREIRIERSG